MEQGRCCFSIAYLHLHTGGEFWEDHDSRTMYINLRQPATKKKKEIKHKIRCLKLEKHDRKKKIQKFNEEIPENKKKNKKK